MLAPNLYEVMRDINRVTNGPVKIFEAGSCFRKESQGAQHMNEFTMLNLVEYASVKEGEQARRLEELAHGAMRAVGIDKYELKRQSSGVYIETLDIEVDGVEIASGSFGPHPLESVRHLGRNRHRHREAGHGEGRIPDHKKGRQIHHIR